MESEQNLAHKYALVQFEHMEFSVVPIFWLEEPNYCYWPQGIKNIRTGIVRAIPVQDDWIKYKCNIISKHVTYELALKAEKEAVASSESENERQSGKRKVKHNKNKDYVDYVGPPRLISSCKKLDDTSSMTTEPLKQSNQNPELDNVEQNDGNATLTDDINNASVIIAEGTDDFIYFINEFKELMKDVQFELGSMKDKQEQSLLQIQETTNMILAKINSEQYRREDTTIKDNKIGKYLPLTSIENFLELEDVLKNDEEALMQIVDKVLLIGGKNEKDFIRRTLAAIFTDNLASICSWTGQKNNFKVGDTHTIMGFKKAFRTAFPRITERDFEFSVMEWFRFANVRKQRKQISKEK